MTDLPTPDQIDGAPHPRETPEIFGHGKVREKIISSFAAGRFHQGWIFAGPKGIGKATLAYQVAGFLLTRPEADGPGLFGDSPVHEMPDYDHPVLIRMRAGSEPGLFILKRPVDEKTGRLKSVISVEEVRKLRNFFGLSAGGNGRRVVIVDAADELNTAAANALLKVLEEPPEMATLILVAHQPSALLPTIRSRCRVETLSPLTDADLERAITQAAPDLAPTREALILGAGSVGATLSLGLQNGADIYQSIVNLMSGMPSFDRSKSLTLSNVSKPDDIALLTNMLEVFLSRMARSVFSRGGVVQQAASGESEVFARLCPTPKAAQAWAEVQLSTLQDLRRGQSVNLDPSALILDTLFKIEKTAAHIIRQDQP